MSGRNPFPDDFRLPPPHVQPHQARRRPPTDYENLLGDALEAAFSAGVWDVDGLVARLNSECIRTPDGREWTVEGFKAVMAVLAEQR